MREPVHELEALLEQRASLLGLARELVRDRGEAEELAQEAWTRAFERPPRADGGAGATRAWFGRVLRNLARDRHRVAVHRREREHATARSEALPGADELAEQFELHRRVVEAVHALDEPYRGAVLMRWFEGLPPRVIAKRIGAPVKTVNTRLERALAMLRARLDRAFGGDRRAWVLLATRAFETGPALAAGGVLLMAKWKLAVAATVVLAAAAVWWGSAVWNADGGSASPHEEHAALAPLDSSRADVEAPGTAPQVVPAEREDASIVHAPPSEPHLTLRVVDLADAPRAGVVVTIGHNPVQGSDIPESLVRDVRELVQRAETGADGYVYFVVPPRREFEALAGLEGCVPLRAEKLVAGMEHVFRLGVPATVTGQLTWIDTGAPVEGALVSPEFPLHGERYAVRTDANGGYVLRGLATPKLMLTVVPPLGAPLVAGVDLAEGGEVVRNFVVGRGRVARGHVRDARTGAPIPNAEIDIPSARLLPRSVRSDDTGAYTFGGIVSGSMATLRARATGYGALSLHAPNDEEVRELDFGLEPERTIRGRVVDENHAPLAGLFLAAERVNSMLLYRIPTIEWTVTRTEADGRFRLSGLNVRDVQRVLVYGEGRGARSLELNEDDRARTEVDLGEIVLAPSGSIAGRVLEADGAPIPDARVNAHLASDASEPVAGIVRRTTLARNATTDDGGAYELLDVPPGRWMLRAELSGRVMPASFEVEVPPGARVLGIDVRLRAPLPIRGVVRGPDGAPSAGAIVSCSNTEAWATSRIASAADGSFELAGLQPGRYVVFADPPPRPDSSTPRSELAGAVANDVEAGTRDLVLELRRIVSVKGRVVDARGDPLEHAIVMARRAGKRYESQSTSDSKGRFTLRCVANEPHRVLVERTEPDPASPTGRRVEPPAYIDLELDWTCVPDEELVLRVPDRPR